MQFLCSLHRDTASSTFLSLAPHLERPVFQNGLCRGSATLHRATVHATVEDYPKFIKAGAASPPCPLQLVPNAPRWSAGNSSYQFASRGIVMGLGSAQGCKLSEWTSKANGETCIPGRCNWSRSAFT